MRILPNKAKFLEKRRTEDADGRNERVARSLLDSCEVWLWERRYVPRVDSFDLQILSKPPITLRGQSE
jgi:hypothetical protein